eukprot:Clim_evm5s18 gene=Clim_evmTU5s18
MIESLLSALGLYRVPPEVDMNRRHSHTGVMSHRDSLESDDDTAAPMGNRMVLEDEDETSPRQPRSRYSAGLSYLGWFLPEDPFDMDDADPMLTDENSTLVTRQSSGTEVSGTELRRQHSTTTSYGERTGFRNRADHNHGRPLGHSSSAIIGRRHRNVSVNGVGIEEVAANRRDLEPIGEIRGYSSGRTSSGVHFQSSVMICSVLKEIERYIRDQDETSEVLGDDHGVLLDKLQQLVDMTAGDGNAEMSARKEFGRNRGIDLMVELIRKYAPEPEVLEYCFATLRYVTKGEVQNIEAATNAGAIQSTVAAMRAYPTYAGLQKYCCMIFRSLTFNHMENQRSVTNFGGMSLVLTAMSKHADNAGVLAAACMALQNLTWFVPENREIMKEERGIPLITQAMQKFPDDAELQKWACGTLQNLACCDPCVDDMLQLECLEAVRECLINHRSDPLIQNYGLGVFRNLSFHRAALSYVIRIGAMDVAVRAIQSHPLNTEIHVFASALMEKFVTVEQARLDLLSQGGSVLISITQAASTYSDTAAGAAYRRALDTVANGRDYIRPQHYSPNGEGRVPTLFELCARHCRNKLPTEELEVPYSVREIKSRMRGSRLCDVCNSHYYNNELVCVVKQKPAAANTRASIGSSGTRRDSLRSSSSSGLGFAFGLNAGWYEDDEDLLDADDNARTLSPTPSPVRNQQNTAAGQNNGSTSLVWTLKRTCGERCCRELCPPRGCPIQYRH